MMQSCASEGRLGLALQCPQRSQFHPRAVGKLHRVTIRRELRHFDQIIKLEHGGTDRRQKKNDYEAFLNEPLAIDFG